MVKKAYDLQTKFATSAVAPGMKTVCQFAISNENRIDEQSLIEQGFALNPAGGIEIYSQVELRVECGMAMVYSQMTDMKLRRLAKS